MKSFFLGKNGAGKPGNGSLLTVNKKPKYGKYSKMVEIPQTCITVPPGQFSLDVSNVDSFIISFYYSLNDGKTRYFYFQGYVSGNGLCSGTCTEEQVLDVINREFPFIGEFSWDGTNIQIRKLVVNGSCVVEGSINIEVYQD